MSELVGWWAGQPEWLLPAAIAIAVLVVLIAAWGLRGSRWLSGIGPQAVVALGGVTVSVHGLWGFATSTAGLSDLLAIAFIGVFDAAEMVLLVMLYRAADPEVGWTRELRMMHRTAWTLVSFSAAMNAIHAPNWWSRPVLAAIPALATWLIELQLRAKLGTHDREEDDESTRPGPVRLVLLIWQHAWARLFAALGLDARSSSSAIARAALAQNAASAVYRFRLTLNAPAGRWWARRRLCSRRRSAQKALDRADIATDSGQALAVMRRLAALTRADDVARLDYANPTAVLELVEQLAVTPAADHLAATSRAQAAETARQRAEDAQREAETARQRAEDATTAAREELDRIEQEASNAQERAAAARKEDHTARQRAEAAQAEIEAARQRAAHTIDSAQQDAERARTEAEQRLAQLHNAIQEEEKTLAALFGRREQEAREEAAQQDRLRQLTSNIREAQLVRDRLSGDLAALTDGAPAAEEPLFRSEAKQAGWRHYLHVLDTSEGREEPTAGDLADRFGVNSGNARNWLADFRAARAAQLAAHPPRAAAHTGLNGHAQAGV